ncbi:putative inactive receptor kinase [Raphanus sativus]|nr:putative inactive receptor kinase [Raphanus sativus]
MDGRREVIHKYPKESIYLDKLASREFTPTACNPIHQNSTRVCTRPHHPLRIASSMPCFPNIRLSNVIGLYLAATDLRGHLELSTIARLTNLRFLSLSSNNISGPFPSSLQALKNLTELRLDLNEFSGPLPSDFSSWEHLRVLDLSHNRFNGSIPSSFEKLTQLHSLNLSSNKFSGEIPNLHIPGLKLLNIAHNNLTGTVPKSLQRFPLSAFVGNNLAHVPSSSLRRQTKHHHNHIVLGVALSTCFALLSLCCHLIGDHP